MNRKKIRGRIGALAFLTAVLASCGTPAEINVACGVADLIQAVHSANADTDTTKLVLTPDCPYTFDLIDNHDGGQGPNALPAVTTKIIIEGNNATLVRSDTTGYGFRFFFITGTGSLRLEDLTLENGNALLGPDQPAARGGAVFNDGGGFTAVRSSFRGNWALHGEGGAIYNLGTLTLDDNILFEVNQSKDGGAVYNGGDVGIQAVLQDVLFLKNLAENSGGAVYNASAETGLTIQGSSFASNHSRSHGGAIYTAGGDLDISYSAFMENQAGKSDYPFGDGGAIYSLAADVILSSVDFIHQTAYGTGGVLYAGPASQVALRRVRADENRACRGGGTLYVEGTTQILDTTFRLNQAGGPDSEWAFEEPYWPVCTDKHGGAIYNARGIVTLERSLLDRNEASGEGDGVYNDGILSIVNSTFHYECCRDPFQYVCCPQKQAVYNQGIAEVSLSTIMHAGLVNSGILTVKNIVLTSFNGGCINSGNLTALHLNITTDPSCPFSDIHNFNDDLGIALFLSNNGGPTLTHEVFGYSPVISNASCSTAGGLSVHVDQRGFPRPYPAYGGCDIGAFEVQTSPQPTAPVLPTQPTATFTAPPPPTEQPVVGCLVQITRGGGTECVVPCPEGAYPGTPCTP